MGTVVGLIWFLLTYLPLTWLKRESMPDNLGTRIAICLFPNTALYSGLRIIVDLEQEQIGKYPSKENFFTSYLRTRLV